MSAPKSLLGNYSVNKHTNFGNRRDPSLLELNLSLLDRVRRLEAEQHLMTQAFNELRRRIDIGDKSPALTASAVAAVNLRPPVSER